jgi:uridine kinase
MNAEGHSSIDDIIDVYKRDVDVSLIVEGLKWSVEERLERLMQFQAFIEELRAGRVSRGE